jgi:TPR repeat protein
MEKYCNSYLNQILAAKKRSSPKEVQQGVNEAVSQIRAAAKKKVKEAVVAYSYLQIVGYKIEQKPVEAKERLSSMIQKQSCPEAMFFVATAFYYGDLEYPEDKPKAEQLYREIAVNKELNISDKKRAIASKEVAKLYQLGTSVTEDLSESARFYELACKHGCEKSSLMLGKVYLSGAEGVFGTIFEKDTKKGLGLLHGLAEKGDEEAKEELLKYHLRESIKWARTSGETELIKASQVALDKLEWMLK